MYIYIDKRVSVEFSFSSDRPLVSLELFSIRIFHPSSVLGLFSVLYGEFSYRSGHSCFSVKLGTDEVTVAADVIPGRVTTVAPPYSNLGLHIFFRVCGTVELTVTVGERADSNEIFAEVGRKADDAVSDGSKVGVHLCHVELVMGTTLDVTRVGAGDPITLIPEMSPGVVLFYAKECYRDDFGA